MTKLPPPIRSAQAPVAAPQRRVAPARRAALRADQPTVGTSVSVLGAAAERASRRRRRGLRGGFPRRRRPRFAGSNSSRSIRRSPGRCASAWRLRAATACAALARHREDSSALRDAEHLSPNAGGNAPTSPAGRIHRLWRLFRARPSRRSTRRRCASAADLLGPAGRPRVSRALADALRDLAPAPKLRWRRPRGASAAAMKLFRDAPRVDAEIFALWLSDLALGATAGLGRAGSAARDGDRASVVAPRRRRQASAPRRSGLGGRRCAAPMRWPPRRLSPWRASCRAVRKRCLAAQPKLRAKGAGRVVELLLGDDACRRRPRRNRRGCPIAPAVVCSIGWSSLAPCANSPAARIFGSMACEARSE